MIQTSLTYQLAQMALENQYDRTALCWDITALDYEEDALQEDMDLHERVSMLLLGDEDLRAEVTEEPVSAEVRNSASEDSLHVSPAYCPAGISQ